MKIGDVVQLKGSVNHHMTVEGVSGDKIRCVWFDQSGLLLRENFQAKSLQIIIESSNTNESKSDLLLG